MRRGRGPSQPRLFPREIAPLFVPRTIISKSVWEMAALETSRQRPQRARARLANTWNLKWQRASRHNALLLVGKGAYAPVGACSGQLWVQGIESHICDHVCSKRHARASRVSNHADAQQTLGGRQEG